MRIQVFLEEEIVLLYAERVPCCLPVKGGFRSVTRLISEGILEETEDPQVVFRLRPSGPGQERREQQGQAGLVFTPYQTTSPEGI